MGPYHFTPFRTYCIWNFLLENVKKTFPKITKLMGDLNGMQLDFLLWQAEEKLQKWGKVLVSGRAELAGKDRAISLTLYTWEGTLLWNGRHGKKNMWRNLKILAHVCSTERDGMWGSWRSWTTNLTTLLLKKSERAWADGLQVSFSAYFYHILSCQWQRTEPVPFQFQTCC